MALQTWGQKCFNSEVEPFKITDFDLGHPVLQKFREIKERLEILGSFFVLQKFREIKDCFESSDCEWFLVLQKIRQTK